MQGLEEHGGVDVDEIGAGLAEAVDDGRGALVVEPPEDAHLLHCTASNFSSTLAEPVPRDSTMNLP